MGFNLYFAGGNKVADEYILQRGCCKLYSQANDKKAIHHFAETNINHKCKLFIDSGAFSVAHSGKQVNIENYISFIEEMDSYVDVWVQLDSIPFPELNAITAKKCSEESWENYLYMVNKVPSPEKLLPLYHFGEPKENLRRILDTPIDVLGNKPAPYIGVGGRHGVSSEAQMHYFDDVFKIVKNSANPNVKIHAFGMTVLPLLEMFPFYSADSTRWVKAAAFGQIFTPVGLFFISDDARSIAKRPNHFLNVSKEHQKEILKYIEEKGYDYSDLSISSETRALLNIDFFQDWADNYQYKPCNVRRKRLI